MLNRFSARVESLTVGTSAAASSELVMSEFAMGMFFVPAGSSITTITWYAAVKAGGTYFAAYDEFVSAITQVVSASKAYQLPSGLCGAAAIKAVGDAAGTIAVVLKG